jgi:superfamily II DNA or RNA helicase
VLAKWAEYDRLLLVAPTGSGKTIMFSHICDRGTRQDGGRTLILAHRDELIDQAIDKLHAAIRRWSAPPATGDNRGQRGFCELALKYYWRQ